MHTFDIQTRFTDYDMFGHVNNNAYLQYLDLAKAMFFNEITGRPFDPGAVSSVVVNININFCAPTRIAEPLQVRTTVAHLGDRSFTLGQAVVNPATGQVKCEGTTVMAGFDLATQTGAPLPAPLKTALAEHLEKKM